MNVLQYFGGMGGGRLFECHYLCFMLKCINVFPPPPKKKGKNKIRNELPNFFYFYFFLALSIRRRLMNQSGPNLNHHTTSDPTTGRLRTQPVWYCLSCSELKELIEGIRWSEPEIDWHSAFSYENYTTSGPFVANLKNCHMWITILPRVKFLPIHLHTFSNNYPVQGYGSWFRAKMWSYRRISPWGSSLWSCTLLSFQAA